MGEAARVLVEVFSRAPLGCYPHQNTGAAANAIHRIVIANQGFHFEKMTQHFPERQAALTVIHGQLNMRDAIDFDTHDFIP